jgi:hypothetical protein
VLIDYRQRRRIFVPHQYRYSEGVNALLKSVCCPTVAKSVPRVLGSQLRSLFEGELPLGLRSEFRSRLRNGGTLVSASGIERWNQFSKYLSRYLFTAAFHLSLAIRICTAKNAQFTASFVHGLPRYWIETAEISFFRSLSMFVGRRLSNFQVEHVHGVTPTGASSPSLPLPPHSLRSLGREHYSMARV